MLNEAMHEDSIEREGGRMKTICPKCKEDMDFLYCPRCKVKTIDIIDEVE
jgi:predicted amidophosphoribosyltransferase